MTYAENSQRSDVSVNQMAVLYPRMKVTSWSLVSGAVYQAMVLGTRWIESVAVNGEWLVPVTGTPAAGEFSFDSVSGNLLVRLSDDSNPTSKFVVVTIEIYIGTFSDYVNRVPTDDSSDEVFVEGRLSTIPTPKSEMSDLAFGVVPVTTSSIEIANADGFLDELAHKVSWSRCDVVIYQCLGDFEPTNWKEIASGLTDSVTVDDGSISITLVNPFERLNQNFPGNYFGNSANIDRSAAGRPIPFIYGTAEGIRGTNINFNETVNVANNNRFAFLSPLLPFSKGTNTAAYTRGVQSASSGNTTTRTYVPNLISVPARTEKVVVGDRVILARGVWNTGLGWFTSTSRWEYVTVTSIGSGYINHTAISSALPNAPSGGETTNILLPTVTCVDILMDGKKYEAIPDRDYIFYAPYVYGDTLGIEFNSSYATNLGLPRFIGPSDVIVARVRGLTSSNPVDIISDLLSRAGVESVDIDSASFSSVKSICTERLGFSATLESGDQFPSFMDILRAIVSTSLLRLYVNGDGRWALMRLAPMTSSVATADSSVIIEQSVSFEISYADVVSDVIVEFRKPEVSNNPTDQDAKALRVFATSESAKYLHNISKQQIFKSLLFEESDAQILANRLALIFGDQQARITFTATLPIGARSIGDTIEVKRLRLPGFTSDEVTERSMMASIVGIENRGSSLKISADEQVGIQANSGSW
jgi:hypothetical protein